MVSVVLVVSNVLVKKSGTFKRRATERGVFAFVASTLSLRTVGPATVPSHKCDILS